MCICYTHTNTDLKCAIVIFVNGNLIAKKLHVTRGRAINPYADYYFQVQKLMASSHMYVYMYC